MKCFCSEVVLFTVATVIASIAAAQELPQHDRIHIAVQEICPVSGQKLGEHGPPIKVRIGEETVYLCCQACLKGEVNAQHWATIHANFARAKRICPVMQNELPKNPKWTIVEGQIIYVCCPPCTKNIEADPKAFLRQLDELYLASLQTRQPAR